MGLSLQVFFPTENGSTFDHDYFMARHLDVIAESFGPHIEKTVLTRGLVTGPDAPATYHAVATFTFADKTSMDAAMEKVGPAVEDIPNFYEGTPQLYFGEVIG